MFPLPLDRDDLLDSDPIDDTPDVVVEATDHPVFRELVQGQNPIIRLMHVERYLRPPTDWVPAVGGDVRVLARLRNRAPLAVEKHFGKGRVIAFTTTYAPYWNDIALGPCVLVALRLQSYLGFSQRVTEQQTVGHEIDVRLDNEKFRQDIRIFAPGEDPSEPVLIERPAVKETNDARSLLASITPRETSRSGIYEMWFNRVDGAGEADRFAVNVDASEGNLAQTPTRDIVTKLDPVSTDIGYADQYETAAIEQSGFNQSLLLMCLLIVLLLGEQILAYVTSYHPSRRSAASADAGRGLSERIASFRNEEDASWAASASSTQDWARGPDEPLSSISPTTTRSGGVRS